MRLVVNGQDLDGLPEEAIAGTFAVSDYGRFSKPKGGFTNRFKVKKTVNNQRIFESIEFVFVISRVPYKLFEIQAWGGRGLGSLIFTGKAILDEVSDAYYISILEGNSFWFTEIKDLSIRDLDLSAYSGNIFDPDFVSEGRLRTTGLFFPSAEYGLTFNRNLNPAQGTGGIPYSHAWANANEFKPAIQVDFILQAIGKRIGWTFTGLDQIGDYLELCFPFTGGQYERSDKFIDDRRIRLKFENDLDSLNPEPWSLDPSGTYLGESLEVTGKTAGGAEIIKYKAGANDPRLSFNVSGRVRVNSVQGTPNQTYDIRLRIGGFTTSAILVRFLKPGVYEFDLDVDYSDVMNSQTGEFFLPYFENLGGSAMIEAADTFVEIQPVKRFDNTAGADEYYEAQFFLPDLKASDLINWLAFRYGLVFTPDTAKKTIHCTPIKEIIRKKYRAKDWSKKIDLSEDPQVSFKIDNYGQLNRFVHESESDGENKERDKSASFKIANEQLPREKDLFKSKFDLFELTSSFNGELNLPLFLMYPEPDADPVKLPPVICRAVLNNQNTVFAPYQAPFKFPNYEQAASLTTIGLSMSEILNDYYSEFIEILQDIKVVKALIRLNIQDIKELDFTVPVYIDHFKSYFLIWEVKEFKFNEVDSTKVTLFRI